MDLTTEEEEETNVQCSSTKGGYGHKFQQIRDVNATLISAGTWDPRSRPPTCLSARPALASLNPIPVMGGSTWTGTGTATGDQPGH